ncbi:MAG: EAL domain-containing protein [Microcoleus sp. SIO2G3]|nr:EAL domain-containing protein [Microcoleus sp. SIO2G3]
MAYFAAPLLLNLAAGSIATSYLELSRFHQDTLIVDALDIALDTGEGLRVIYQPLKRLGELGRPVRFFEALLRFDLGGYAISPSRFIPLVLADSALSQKLDRFVLDRVSQQMRRDQSHYAVNLTAASMGDRHLVGEIANIFFGLRSQERLILEVIENQRVEESSLIEALNQHSRVWLDDVGMEFSNFGAIATLPVKGLKIHGSFVKSMIRCRRARAIVRGIFQICQELELSCVAEWVETPYHLEAIALMAVEFPGLDLWVQGWGI